MISILEQTTKFRKDRENKEKKRVVKPRERKVDDVKIRGIKSPSPTTLSSKDSNKIRQNSSKHLIPKENPQPNIIRTVKY